MCLGCGGTNGLVVTSVGSKRGRSPIRSIFAPVGEPSNPLVHQWAMHGYRIMNASSFLAEIARASLLRRKPAEVPRKRCVAASKERAGSGFGDHLRPVVHSGVLFLSVLGLGGVYVGNRFCYGLIRMRTPPDSKPIYKHFPSVLVRRVVNPAR